METAPPGSGTPLFRNTRGGGWKRVTGVGRFLAIKRRLGWDQDPVKTKYSTYSCRHTFAYRMLSGYWNSGAGCSIETLAELMGDTPAVTYAHYGRESAQSHHNPLWAAIGVGESG
jgi:integrase